MIKDYYQYVQQLIDQKWLFAKTKYNLNDQDKPKVIWKKIGYRVAGRAHYKFDKYLRRNVYIIYMNANFLNMFMLKNTDNKGITSVVPMIQKSTTE